MRTAFLFAGLAAGIFSLSASPAFAQFDFGANASVQWIENPQLQPVAEESELQTTLGISAQLERETQRFLTLLDYNAFRQDFREDLRQDQRRIQGESSLLWKISPDVLNWRLGNSRQLQSIDVIQGDTTDNRQIIDRTATGPTLTLPLGSANLLRASAEIAEIGFERTAVLEQGRRTYSLGVTRQLPGNLSLSADWNLIDANFDEAESLNFDISSLNLSAALQSENYSLSLEAGQNRTERPGFETTNPLYALRARYSINNQIELAAEFSQTVQDFIANAFTPGIVDQTFQESEVEIENRFSNSNNANIFRIRGGNLGITFSQPSRYTLALRASSIDREVLGTIFQERDDRLVANLQLPLGSRLNVNASATVSRLEFTQFQSGLLDRRELRLTGTYRLTDRIAVNLLFADVSQSGEGPRAEFDGIDVAIGLSFTR